MSRRKTFCSLNWSEYVPALQSVYQGLGCVARDKDPPRKRMRPPGAGAGGRARTRGPGARPRSRRPWRWRWPAGGCWTRRSSGGRAEAGRGTWRDISLDGDWGETRARSPLYRQSDEVTRKPDHLQCHQGSLSHWLHGSLLCSRLLVYLSVLISIQYFHESKLI